MGAPCVARSAVRCMALRSRRGDGERRRRASRSISTPRGSHVGIAIDTRRSRGLRQWSLSSGPIPPPRAPTLEERGATRHPRADAARVLHPTSLSPSKRVTRFAAHLVGGACTSRHRDLARFPDFSKAPPSGAAHSSSRPCGRRNAPVGGDDGPATTSRLHTALARKRTMSKTPGLDSRPRPIPRAQASMPGRSPGSSPNQHPDADIACDRIHSNPARLLKCRGALLVALSHSTGRTPVSQGANRRV